MKQKYTIFYSWQNDTDGDRQYVRNVLQNSVVAIKKELDIEIQIDSDSRDEDGEKSIDVAILKKIENCDFFVCDVTPVGKLHPSDEVYKELPNPNVMLELGFAIGNIGWERCILVWNTLRGAQQNAPFDIRNHITTGYEFSKDMSKEDLKNKGLHLKSVLKGKIVRYDEILAKQQLDLQGKLDYRVYRHWQQIAPFDKLKNSVDRFFSNMAYFDVDFNMWDQLQYEYRNTIEFHFADEELSTSMDELVTNIANMAMFAATYFDPNVVQPHYRKLRDFYDIMDSSTAAKEEIKCIKLAEEHHTNVIDSLMKYRKLIAKIFGE